jgi:hypothetical protein
VEIEFMKTASNNNEFRLHLPGRVSFFIYAKTAEEKEIWCEDIGKSIRGEHQGEYKSKRKENRKSEKHKKLKDEDDNHEIIINESEDSVEEPQPVKPVKTRSKVSRKNRTRSEKITIKPNRKYSTPPAIEPIQPTGNLVEMTPFPDAPNVPQPVLTTPPAPEKPVSSPASHSKEMSPTRRVHTRKANNIPKSTTHDPRRSLDLHKSGSSASVTQFQVPAQSPFNIHPAAFPPVFNSPQNPYNSLPADPFTIIPSANPFTTFPVQPSMIAPQYNFTPSPNQVSSQGSTMSNNNNNITPNPFLNMPNGSGNNFRGGNLSYNNSGQALQANNLFFNNFNG